MGSHRLVVGDNVVIARPGHSQSSPDLAGKVMAVAGNARCPVYRVLWVDGRESMMAASAVQASRSAVRS